MAYYNGKKVIGNAKLDLGSPVYEFANNEYKKSKNLFNAYNYLTSGISGLVVPTITDANNFSVYSSNSWNSAIIKIKVKPNTTYCLSFDIDKSKFFGVKIVDNNSNELYGGAWQPTTHYINTFTTNSNTSYIIMYFCNMYNEGGYAEAITYSNVQLEEGDKETKHYDHNGEIIHKKDIEKVLLWENANINTPFEEQHINLFDNIANYKYIIVEVLGTYYGEKQPRTIEKFLCLGKEFEIILFGIYQTNSSTFSRNIYFGNTGTNASVFNCYKGGVVANTGCIPVRIYGSNY